MNKVALTILPALSLVAYEHMQSGNDLDISWLMAYGVFVGPTILFWLGTKIANSKTIGATNLTLSIIFIATCFSLKITKNEQLVLPAIGIIFLLISVAMLIPSIALRIYGGSSHSSRT